MCDGTSRTDTDLVAALRELDATKAVVRQWQTRLAKAVSALPSDGCPPKGLRILEATSRRMNQATKRYLLAVRAFNAACHTGSSGLEESSRRRPQPTSP